MNHNLLDIKKEIQLTFSDGSISTVDEQVHKLIMTLQNKVQNNQMLPYFWNLSQSIDSYSELLLKFYNYLITNRKLSKSQLYQDLFVLFILDNKTKGTFLEFGATDGLEYSNSFLLENDFNWKGVLAEPSPQWHENLKTNRPKATIIEECIYYETGKSLDFFVSDVGVLSTLEKHKQSDISSMPANTNARNKNGYNHIVKSISLNDVFVKHFNSSPIDYMSVDTEGSELEILENFDFQKFAPKIVTVEHNFTDAQKKLDELFIKNNYLRFFKEHSQFDAWYVLQV
ncbi:FkbM family methyltransferase [Alphaproteobacteria bacterium]|nr:FkbM family methyltransferase [Alphaproteobacteria bacterium]